MQRVVKFLNAFLGSIRRSDSPSSIKPLFPKSVPYYEVENRLHKLTEFPSWDWECFRAVLICLAALGEGRYIPASRRPNRICLDGFQETFAELRRISAQRQGRETSRIVLVDRERFCLVISGKTHVGSTTKVGVDMTPEPGRETVQSPIMTIHVHPDQVGEVGLSDMDYVSFLSDQRQIIMATCFQGGILLAMKTTATRKAIAPETVQRLIMESRNDVWSIWNSLRLPQPLLAFNKAVCTEFGMTLYQATDSNENVARRIKVTDS